MNIIARSLRDRLHSHYRGALWPIHDKVGWHARWLRIKPGHDWSDFGNNRWQYAAHPLTKALLIIGAIYLAGLACRDHHIEWRGIVAGALIIITVIASVVMESHVVNTLVPRLKDLTFVERIIGGAFDTRVIFRYVPFPFRPLFFHRISDRREDDVVLVAMNLDWYSGKPRTLVRWTWVMMLAALVFAAAGMLSSPNDPFNEDWFVFVFLGAFFPLFWSYAMCCWRRRILLGITISHLEKKYL